MELARACRALYSCAEHLPSFCLGTSIWCPAELVSKFKMYSLRRPSKTGKTDALLLHMSSVDEVNIKIGRVVLHQHLRCFVSKSILAY